MIKTKGDKKMTSATLKIVNHGDMAVNYKALDASCVMASHIAECGFQKNPAYQYENERRYHAEPISQDKVIGIACALDSGHLLDITCIAGSGMPVVDAQGNVLGGNGRTMAIQYAYAKNFSGAIEYRRNVQEFCRANGIECRCANPILVREIARPLTHAEGQALISALNDNFTHAKSNLADAHSRGARFSTKTLKALAAGLTDADSLRDYFDNPASLELVNMLQKDGVILETEMNQFSNGGYLNPEGKRLVECALRSIVAPSLETLAKLPAPIIAKIDAALPYVLMAANIHQNWSIRQEFSDALILCFEYRTSCEKEIAVFMAQFDMVKGGCPNDRFTEGAKAIFHLLQKEGKSAFVKRFKTFNTEAAYSLENGGLAPIRTWQDSIKANFGFEKMDAPTNNTQELEEMENTIENRIETVKAVKSSKGKNDCTKNNSSLICAVQSAKEDMAGILELAAKTLGGDIEIIANSRTQYRIANFDGYRIIRSGRQWQLRLLNDHVETVADNAEMDSAPMPVEPVQIENNDDNSSVEMLNQALQGLHAAYTSGDLQPDNTRHEIQNALCKLNWHEGELNVKGGTRGGVHNPDGNRIVTYSFEDNILRASCGWDTITEIELETAQEVAATDNETRVWYSCKSMRSMRVYVTKIYGNGAMPIKQGINWRIFKDNGHVQNIWIKKEGEKFVLYEELPQEDKNTKNNTQFLAMDYVYCDKIEDIEPQLTDTDNDILDSVNVHMTPARLCSIKPTNDTIVFNAPRPLMGKKIAEGNFIMGKFWAQCDKNDIISIKNNIKMDATIIMPYNEISELADFIMASSLIPDKKKEFYKNRYETGIDTKAKYFEIILRHYKDITYKEYVKAITHANSTITQKDKVTEVQEMPVNNAQNNKGKCSNKTVITDTSIIKIGDKIDNTHNDYRLVIAPYEHEKTFPYIYRVFDKPFYNSKGCYQDIKSAYQSDNDRFYIVNREGEAYKCQVKSFQTKNRQYNEIIAPRVQEDMAYREYINDLNTIQFDIFEHLLGMGYESNKYLSHSISITVKGGFKGEINKEGLRRVTISRYKEFLFATYGGKEIYKLDLYKAGTAKDLSMELHNAIMEWDKKTGDYDKDNCPQGRVHKFTPKICVKRTTGDKIKSIGIQHELAALQYQPKTPKAVRAHKTSGQLSLW